MKPRKNWYDQGPYAKTKNALGKTTVEEMDAMAEDELKTVILSANQSMKEVNDELEKNEKYAQIKRDKSFLETGKREVEKRQKARVKYALYLLEEKGKQISGEEKKAS